MDYINVDNGVNLLYKLLRFIVRNVRGRRTYNNVESVYIPGGLDDGVVVKIKFVKGTWYVVGYDEWQTNDGKTVISPEIIGECVAKEALRIAGIKLRQYCIINPQIVKA